MREQSAAVRRRAGRSILETVSWAAAVWLAAVPMLGAQASRPEPQPTASDRVLAVAVQQPSGIAAGGGRLWVSDGATREVLELAPDTGAVKRRFALGLQQPQGLAFDGSLLWVADQASRKLHAFDPDSGQAVREIPLAVPPEKGYASVGALTWDGQRLWTAIAAGFSSSFNQIDRDSGQIVRSLFADCDPRGLAVRGQQLFSLCYNGPKYGPTLDVRTLGADDGAITRSRRFVKRLTGNSASGLTYDGQTLWWVEPGSVKGWRFAAGEAGKP